MNLEKKLKLLPDLPGCYLMKDHNEKIIYVGKAKNLKNRVKSYFIGAHNEKTTRLVSEISDFSYVVTNSEHEALILEINLIKENSPQYNIKLMDDKTYPYIELTDEAHPRLLITRNTKGKKRIFGPFPNVSGARETATMLNRLYPFRKCEYIPKKECLYYHMGQCLGPCIKDELFDYKEYIVKVTRFLKGETKVIIDDLKKKMQSAVDNLEYEVASEYLLLINGIKATTEKQIVTFNDYCDRDFINYVYDENLLSIMVLKMRQGKIIDEFSSVYSYIISPHDEALNFILQYYEGGVIPDELVLSEQFDSLIVASFFEKKVVFPKIGDKKKLLDLVKINVKKNLSEHHLLNGKLPITKNERGLLELSQIAKKPIQRIEVIDNAQLFGTAPISTIIVYEKNGFIKEEYRKYNLKSTSNDDYQAMKEVTYRRYYRLLIENKPFPDILFVDGGIGQVHAAMSTITELNLNVIVAGLKKNNKHELESLIFNENEIVLDKHSMLYLFLASLSEEVHRYAISFHIKKRTSNAFNSPLDSIKGIGVKRKKALLSHFSSIEEIKKASADELSKIGLDQKTIILLKEGLK